MRFLLVLLLALLFVAVSTTSLNVVRMEEGKALNNTGFIWYLVGYKNGTFANVTVFMRFDVLKLKTELDVRLNNTPVGRMSVPGIPPLTSPRYIVLAEGRAPVITEGPNSIRFFYEELRGDESLRVSVVRFNATEVSSCSAEGKELRPLEVDSLGAGVVIDVYGVRVGGRVVECAVKSRVPQLPKFFGLYLVLTVLSASLLALSLALATSAISRLR